MKYAWESREGRVILLGFQGHSRQGTKLSLKDALVSLLVSNSECIGKPVYLPPTGPITCLPRPKYLRILKIPRLRNIASINEVWASCEGRVCLLGFQGQRW